jgi:predicted dehydrogenase
MKKPLRNFLGSLTRRDFCRTALGAAAAMSVPLIVPPRLFGANAPSNRLRIGHIGCGRIARGHDMPGVLNSELADIVAVCDLDAKRLADGKTHVETFYRDATRVAPAISTYGNYPELLSRSDIDGVVISLPDHQHAEVAIAALRAGKDVYLQKPFTMTHAEGVLLRDEVARTKRILQVGSQQRSWNDSQQFRKACEFVRSGRVGRLTNVEIGLPIDPTKPDDPEQPIPSNLNYEAWLGPTPQVYYTEQRVHPQNDYSRPGWLRNESFCLGMITGWGAHHFDTAHWGMNLELSGPSRIEGKADFPTNKIWNVHGAYDVHLVYPGDIRLAVSDEFPNGIKFIGDEGWIFVSREPDKGATSSDPAIRATTLKPLDASDPKLLDPDGVTVKFPESSSHHKNWLECVKSRATPLSPAPIAHRANTACILSWIAMKLGRPLNWDVQTERFVNDEDANAMLSRPERPPYGAHAV